jgi:hypothetical protein
VTILGFEGKPEWAELVQRVFHGDAPGSVVPPGVVLASDRPEWQFLRRERLWLANKGLAALPANFNQFILFSPGGFDSIAVITHLITDSDSLIGIPAAAVAASNVTSVSLRDGRGGLGAQGFTQLGSAQAAASSLPLNGRFLLKASVVYGPGLLPPFLTFQRRGGTGAGPGTIVIESTVVNVGQNVWLAGYERLANPEELGFG